MLKITQVRSGIRRQKDHKDTLRALGLRRPHQSVYHEDSATVRGMVRKIGYLLEVTEVEAGEAESANVTQVEEERTPEEMPDEDMLPDQGETADRPTEEQTSEKNEDAEDEE